MAKRRIWITVIIVLLLASGSGYVAYTRFFAPSEAVQEPILQTATVTLGDIIITVDGSGELVPAAELALAFRTGGVLDEVLVEVGDQVREDDLLAQLETDDLERALAQAGVEVELAQLDLADAREGPGDAELADGSATLRDAQVELALAQDAYENTSDSNLDAIADSRKVDFDWWVGYYQKQKSKYEDGHLSQSDHDWAMNAMISTEGQWNAAINQALAEEAQAKNRLDQAQNDVYQAWENLQLLQNGPTTDTLERATLAVDQTLLAREKALADLEAAQLYAPFDGTVMEVAATVGERAGANTPILTLADLAEPLVRFWVEEMDMSSVAVGNPVRVTFEAWPDDTFTGEIVRVTPVLVTVEGTSAVQAWASVDLGVQEVNLVAGMTAEVEVIAAEASGALFMPVEALRETSPGQYAVFVVKPDGELELRMVTVGLMDPVSVEILDGLELGEVVSIGEME